MGKQLDKNTLGYLGVDFQYKLTKLFIEDHSLFSQLKGTVNPNAFTDQLVRTVVGTLVDYYDSEGLVPSYETLSILLNSKSRTDSDIEEFDAVIKKLRFETTTEGCETNKDLAIKFFKQQNLIKVANSMLDIASKGDLDRYDECQKMLDEAALVGQEDDLGFSPFDRIEEALSPTYTVHIPTGIKTLDDALNGGLAKKKLGMIIGSSGFGKALADDELVITPTGPKMIKELAIGDYVIGSDGKPTKVIGVFPQGLRDIYKVTFNDKTSCRCDKEHIWTVTDKSKDSGSKKIVSLTLGEMVESGIKTGKKHNYRIQLTKPVKYQSRDLLINPYVMGYMIGDGNINRGAITVGKNDEDCIIKILSKYWDNISIQNHKNRATTISFIKGDFRNKLSKYFTMNETSGDKFIPEDYKFNSIENRILLLNGLMDSYGTSQKNGTSCFNTKSKKLAQDIRDIVLSLGGFAYLREKKCGYFNRKYNEYRDCGIQYEVTITLTDNKIPLFQLKRKQDRVKYRTLYANNKYIDSVEFDKTQNAICIKVDASDELFLTNDYIVTHNTTMSTAIASYASTYKCDLNNYEGYKALQIYFEDDDVDMVRKHISKKTMVESRYLTKSKEQTDEIRNILEHLEDKEALKKNLRLKAFKAHAKTATDIGYFIRKLINSGWKPDLVIIDYFECIAPEKGGYKTDSKWDREGVTMRMLENIAKEYDIAMWVPTQGNKESMKEEEIVTMDQAGGSITKMQVASVIISLARTVEMQENNKATLGLIKNRGGALGIWKDIEYDNGTCTISCDNVVTYDSAKAYIDDTDKIKEANEIKLKRRLAELQQKENETIS